MDRIICVKNLSSEVDICYLSNHFTHCGKILSATIEYDKDFNSLCKGQILFQSAEGANAALKMNGTPLVGNKVVVYRSSDIGPVIKSYTKVFVKNIPQSWDDCDLIKNFETFGEIISASISVTNGESNGYGFVSYKQHPSAKNAVKEMNDQVMENYVLQVKPFIPKELRGESNSLESAKERLQKSVQRNNLHVKNLPKGMEDEKFLELFEQFGTVTSMKIARNNKNESLGFGFVAFQSEKEAEKARFRMNGFSIGSNILEVNFHQKKEDRQNYLQMLKSKTENVQAVKPFGQSMKPFANQGQKKPFPSAFKEQNSNIKRNNSPFVFSFKSSRP